MLNIIIKAIFWLIGKIGDIVLIPIMAVINAAFPSFSFNFDYIFNYLGYGFNYIVYFLKLFMIPPLCIQFVLYVFTISLTLTVGIRGYQFIVRVYNKFKP